MFFRKKAQNRRLGREYVLDVKLRSSQTRKSRARLMAISAGVLFGLAIVVYAVCFLGGWALDRLAYRNPAFALQQIDLQTDGVISSEQLRRWSGVKPGDNLLAMDLGAVKKNLEINPCIQKVSVERILPRTLCIRVSEREPIAQLVVQRQRPSGDTQQVTYQLDAQGCVMLPLEPHQRSVPVNPAAEQMPVIVGFKTADAQPGRFLDSVQARAALNLVQAFDRSQMGGFIDLKKIDAGTPEVLIATTGQGSEIIFGLNDMDQQLRRWHDIYEMGQRLSKAISNLDLAVSNNIPARWMEASAVPPTPPKLPKPWRTKKKHV
jgi:cell division septal protein FtsQ